ncbi:MAG: DUF1648 domain-containing protein [Clostridia bacterium]|nr:DUF1648 domain-containing protein [Clostridia bacterium]
MKFFKWRVFIITSIVCLLPILLGIALWDKLPDVMAIHFNFYGVADNFAPKGCVVFGLPVLMVALQAFCCFMNDTNVQKNKEIKKFEAVTKWIIPCVTVFLYIVTLGYSLGWDLDIRKAVAFIVGVLFIVTGKYLPEFDSINGFNIEKEKARKINRFIGYETVIMGILFLISILLPPVCLMICLFLLIPYAIISIVYGIIIGRK